MLVLVLKTVHHGLSDHIFLHSTGKFWSPKNPSTYPMPLWKTSPGMPKFIFLTVQKNKGAMPYAKKTQEIEFAKLQKSLYKKVINLLQITEP